MHIFIGMNAHFSVHYQMNFKKLSNPKSHITLKLYPSNFHL